MNAAVAGLLDILDLEVLEHDLFRGRSPQVGWQRVFGGQVVGQALVAATRTVKDRPVHSLHGYFLRPGDPSVPIVYQVERIRDGGSFTTRRVMAIQHGKPIFSMAASFHTPEPEALTHQVTMPQAPVPEDLPGEKELQERFLQDAPENVQAYWRRERPIELRPTNFDHYVSDRSFDPHQQVWVRATGPLPDDPAIHTAVLAYASDMTLFDTALFAHGSSVFDRSMQLASLDHAMWFHAPFRADDWLLYDQDSPSSGGARGFCRGSLWTRDGRLVVSTAQEGLMRRAATRTRGTPG
jgi:acyl-CoA thioesterase-2